MAVLNQHFRCQENENSAGSKHLLEVPAKRFTWAKNECSGWLKSRVVREACSLGGSSNNTSTELNYGYFSLPRFVRSFQRVSRLDLRFFLTNTPAIPEAALQLGKDLHFRLGVHFPLMGVVVPRSFRFHWNRRCYLGRSRRRMSSCFFIDVFLAPPTRSLPSWDVTSLLPQLLGYNPA